MVVKPSPLGGPGLIDDVQEGFVVVGEDDAVGTHGDEGVERGYRVSDDASPDADVTMRG